MDWWHDRTIPPTGTAQLATQLGTGLTTPQRVPEPDPGGHLAQMTSDPPFTEQGTDTGLLEALTSVFLGRCILVSWQRVPWYQV